MKIERGDSIKFGIRWCEERDNEDLIGKTIKLTPQYFEEDNGLYCYESECPGIYNEEDEEADSIYHLFGNNLENFMDCKLIKGTKEDKEAYQKIVQSNIEEENNYWTEMVKELSVNEGLK